MPPKACTPSTRQSLNREVFYTLKEVEVLTERWMQHYNQVRPHSSLGYGPPVPETILVHQTAHELVKLT
ncbi:MAG: integrase core domain-containing protein [Chloroflexi bacterium]|nr:integrase core domain-containing protein [Chloroflexota bacterium]